MNYGQFEDLSCYEEFEMQSTLAGISKIDILREIGQQKHNYYFFVSKDGIFNWFDLEGNHIEDPHVLKMLRCEHIPNNITKCIIPNSVIDIMRFVFYKCKYLTSITILDNVLYIGNGAFSHCESLTSITIPNKVIYIDYRAFSYCDSLKEIIFKGKTLKQVKHMKYYPFGIEDESIIKCEI